MISVCPYKVANLNLVRSCREPFRLDLQNRMYLSGPHCPQAVETTTTTKYSRFSFTLILAHSAGLSTTFEVFQVTESVLVPAFIRLFKSHLVRLIAFVSSNYEDRLDIALLYVEKAISVFSRVPVRIQHDIMEQIFQGLV